MKFVFLFVCAPLAFGENATTNVAVSASSALNNLADAEQRLLRGGHGVLRGATQVTEEVEKALGKTDPKKAVVVAELMAKLQDQESHIMHSEEKEAIQDRKAAQKQAFVALSQHATQKVSQKSSVTMLNGHQGKSSLARAAARRAIVEVHQVAENLHIVKEIDQAKSVLAQTLGKQAPAVEAEVEKYLRLASHTEEHLVADEYKRAGKLIGQAAKAGVTLEQLKHGGVPQPTAAKVVQVEHRKPITAQVQTQQEVSSGTSKDVQDFAATADKELRHAQQSLAALKATQEVDRAFVKELAAKNPRKAKKIMRAFVLSEKQERQEVKAEFAHAKLEWKKAVAAESAKLDGSKNNKKTGSHTAHHHKQHPNAVGLSNDVTTMAELADKEFRTASKGLHMFQRLKSIDSAIQDAISHPNPRSARRVRQLLSMTQNEQGKDVRDEFRDAKRDWQLAVSAESEELHPRKSS